MGLRLSTRPRLIEGQLQLPTATIPDTGELEADLVAWLDGATAAFADPQVGPLVIALVTAATDSESEARLLYEMSTGPVHRAIVGGGGVAPPARGRVSGGCARSRWCAPRG